MRNTNVAIHTPQLNALQEQTIDNFFDGLEQILNFGEALRPNERREIVKLVRQNLIFVREAMEAIDEVPEILPTYVSGQDINNRFQLHEQLRMLEDKTGAFYEKVRDLRYVVGRQVYEDGLMIYGGAKFASQNRVPKATYYYNRLRRRFMNQGGNQGQNSTDPNPTDPNSADPNNPDPNTPQSTDIVEDVNSDPEMGTNAA